MLNDICDHCLGVADSRRIVGSPNIFWCFTCSKIHYFLFNRYNVTVSTPLEKIPHEGLMWANTYNIEILKTIPKRDNIVV